MKIRALILPILTLCFASCKTTETVGVPRHLELKDFEKIEQRHHPYSSWSYVGTSGNFHRLIHYSEWSEKKHRVSTKLLHIEDPHSPVRDKWRRVSIAFKDDHVRFSVSGQEPQIIDYRSRYLWNDYRYGPSFAEYRNKNRSSLALWEGMTVFADEIGDGQAKGRVLVELTHKPDRFNFSPTFIYGDELEFSIADKSLRLAGKVAADFPNKRYLGDDGTEILTAKGRLRFVGTTQKLSHRPPDDRPVVSKLKDSSKNLQLPDFSKFMDQSRPSLELWDGVTLYADKIEGWSASGEVVIESDGEGSENFRAIGKEVAWSRNARELTMDGLVGIEWDGRVTLPLSNQVKLVLDGQTAQVEGPTTHWTL